MHRTTRTGALFLARRLNITSSLDALSLTCHRPAIPLATDRFEDTQHEVQRLNLLV